MRSTCGSYLAVVLISTDGEIKDYSIDRIEVVTVDAIINPYPPLGKELLSEYLDDEGNWNV